MTDKIDLDQQVYNKLFDRLSIVILKQNQDKTNFVESIFEGFGFQN